VSPRHDQRIERKTAARQHDKGIDIDRLHDVAQILGDAAESLDDAITEEGKVMV